MNQVGQDPRDGLYLEVYYRSYGCSLFICFCFLRIIIDVYRILEYVEDLLFVGKIRRGAQMKRRSLCWASDYCCFTTGYWKIVTCIEQLKERRLDRRWLWCQKMKTPCRCNCKRNYLKCCCKFSLNCLNCCLSLSLSLYLYLSMLTVHVSAVGSFDWTRLDFTLVYHW